VRQLQVVVSSTRELAGWRITAHLDIVTAHVVAGTGLLSDIAASISDIAGGRSKSYQEQLSEINKEAINLIRSRAAELGAEGVVGLTISHSELSGKGKQMLMVTALGTAVRATPINEEAIRAAQSVGAYDDLEDGCWRCRCGRSNSEFDETCSACGRAPDAVW
jgi:uncharacterized protein YbjQ (UPF0145 family)